MKCLAVGLHLLVDRRATIKCPDIVIVFLVSTNFPTISEINSFFSLAMPYIIKFQFPLGTQSFYDMGHRV